MHVSGSALGDGGMAAKVLRVCKALHDKGVAITFDPNVRKELIGNPAYFGAVKEIIGMASIFLPSDEDALTLFPGRALEDYAAELFANGARAVVLKKGDKGCEGVTREGERASFAAHKVTVLDPTGAGDCFCATFVTLWTKARSASATRLRGRTRPGLWRSPRSGRWKATAILRRSKRCCGGTHDVAGIWPTLIAANRGGQRRGNPSWCTAHPETLSAILRACRDSDDPVLIEATCNQVNQEGGYTGMTPAGFRRFIEDLAREAGVNPERLILGGDHLGPNPWKRLPASEAMARASEMVKAYVEAGFRKIHLDASMACGDETHVTEATIAERGAALCAVAELVGRGGDRVYVIGTEVPIPGGELEDLDALAVTRPRRRGAPTTSTARPSPRAASGMR